jgi:hypothetical protein
VGNSLNIKTGWIGRPIKCGNEVIEKSDLSEDPDWCKAVRKHNWRFEGLCSNRDLQPVQKARNTRGPDKASESDRDSLCNWNPKGFANFCIKNAMVRAGVQHCLEWFTALMVVPE